MTIEETLAAINNSTILNQFSSAFDGANTNHHFNIIPTTHSHKLDTSTGEQPERAKRME